MDIEEAKRRARDKNARISKVVPVDIDGVGTLYVRLIKVGEGSEMEKAISESTEDSDTRAIIAAALLCHEDGSRLTPEDEAEWREIFAAGLKADCNAILTAANTAGRPPGN